MGTQTEAPKRGRPTSQEALHRQTKAAQVLDSLTSRNRQERRDAKAAIDTPLIHTSEAMHGVTVGWLATIFRMDPTTVKKKLRDCAPIATRKAGHIYDLKMAAQFLVKPMFDAEQYIKQMKPTELPTHLQEAYWSAMRKRQQWEEAAGHLWRTDQIMEVFGDVFKTIKFAMQLWPDTVEQAQGLSTEQRQILVTMADEMQNEIHHKLLEMPKTRMTLSTLVEAPKPETTEVEEDEDEDVDYSDLI